MLSTVPLSSYGMVANNGKTTILPSVNPASHITVYTMLLTGCSSCLSILGAMLIFLTYYWMRDIQNYTRRLLVYLTIADLLTAVGNLVATVRYAIIHGTNDMTSNSCADNADRTVQLADVCFVQSCVTTFSNLSSFLWTLVIAIHLWSSIVLKTQRTEQFLVTAVYHVVCWSLPLCIVISLHEHLGEDYCFGTGVWCGIKTNVDRKTIAKLMYIADVAWQLFSYITACFLYIHVKFYLFLKHRRPGLAETYHHLRDEDYNFVFVWMIIYLLKLWGLVRFFITTYVPSNVLYSQSMKSFLEFLLYMQSYGASGQAFWNCILFCLLDRTVREYLRDRFFCKVERSERQPLLGSSAESTKC